jgi:hypothetical protein
VVGQAGLQEVSQHVLDQVGRDVADTEAAVGSVVVIGCRPEAGYLGVRIG